MARKMRWGGKTDFPGQIEIGGKAGLMWSRIEEEGFFPPRTLGAYVALAALALLWLAALIDLALWFGRLTGLFSSKANYISHLWPYISLAGAVVGLLARGAPNALRSVPTVWLLVSLGIMHAHMLTPSSPLPAVRGPTLRVMTFNLSRMQAVRRSSRSFFKKRRNLDILFLQEVWGTPERGPRPRFQEAMKELPHAVWHHPADAGSGTGLGILSRYPLRDVRVLPLPSVPFRGGVCSKTVLLTAKLVVKEKIIRVGTVHLCPPAVPWLDEKLRPVDLSAGALWSWFRRVRDFEYARKSQMVMLRLFADGGGEPFILAGDFNATPFSLDMLRISPSMKNAFGERGSGFGFTYFIGPFGAQIDHILFSEGFRVRAAEVISEPVLSDHRPVEALLEILPKGKK